MDSPPPPGNAGHRPWLAAVIAAAVAGPAHAQLDLDQPVTGPIDPRAQSATPREVSGGAALPEVPDRAPERVAVMAFENRSGVRALDWAVAGVPFLIGERIEEVIGLRPAWGARVVPEGPPVPASAAVVAGFATGVDARWVVTGWVERPSWQLRLHVTVWRVDGGAATVAAEHQSTGEMTRALAQVGAALVEVAGAAGWTVPDDGAARLARLPTPDLYAFTLLGRGLGRWLGAIGAADAKLAGKDLTRSVFIDPKMVEGQRLVGELWARDPDPKVAAGAGGKFAYAVDLRPDYLPAVRAAAERARRAGKRDRAVELFTQLVRARPWNLDVRLGLADSLWQLGDGDQAVGELERVTHHRPDDLEARRLLALIRGSRGDIVGLAEELTEVVRLAPDDVTARVDLGAALAELGRLDQALTRYQEVAAARPADPTAHKRVADLYRRKGDVARAVAGYTRTHALSPDDPRPAFLIGATYLEAGQLDEARKALVRAQRFGDWLGHAYVAIGAVAWLQGKPDEALWYLKRAVRKRPHSPVARFDLALVASAKGVTDLADAQLDALAQLRPNDADAAYLRGVVRYRAGDREGARAGFARALALDPGHGDARWNLGALGRGGDDLRLEGAPRLDLPFGDSAAYRAELTRFEATVARMTAQRIRFQGHVVAALLAMGEGPGKDKVAARSAPRTCPLLEVAPHWSEAHAALDSFLRIGLELDELERLIVAHDQYGETAALGPAARQQVAQVRTRFRAAQIDVREMQMVLDRQLGRELKRRRCTDDLLAAAVAQPELYRGAEPPPRPAAGFVPRPPTEPAVATFFIDNRECDDPVAVYVDGMALGEVPSRQRIALQARVGRRALCLMPQPGTATCGDLGTVREVYLHDDWSVIVHCGKR